MNYLFRSRYMLLAALVAATSGGARAMENAGAANVAILSCHEEWSYAPASDGSATGDAIGRVRIVFENRGSADLSKVTFAVEDGGKHIVRQDAGRFSPGIPIDHFFAAGDLKGDTAPLCSVVAATL